MMQSKKPVILRIGFNSSDVSSRVLYSPLTNGVVYLKIMFVPRFRPEHDFDITICSGTYTNGYTFRKEQFPIYNVLDLDLCLGVFEIEASKLGHLIPVYIRFTSTDGLSHISNNRTDIVRVWFSNEITYPSPDSNRPVVRETIADSGWEESTYDDDEEQPQVYES
jgi:hypothetical protein